MRVQVVDGTGTIFLGEGTYTEDTVVYMAVKGDKIITLKDPTQPFAEDQLKELISIGFAITELPTPKIILDSNEIVYGCQVFWKEL